jgi:general stress protein YciG
MTSAQDESPDTEGPAAEARPRPRRGFALMNPERQRAIARLGGLAAHARGHAHEFTPEQARAAAEKRHARGRASSDDSDDGPR